MSDPNPYIQNPLKHWFQRPFFRTEAPPCTCLSLTHLFSQSIWTTYNSTIKLCREKLTVEFVDVMSSSRFRFSFVILQTFLHFSACLSFFMFLCLFVLWMSDSMIIDYLFVFLLIWLSLP